MRTRWGGYGFETYLVHENRGLLFRHITEFFKVFVGVDSAEFFFRGRKTRRGIQTVAHFNRVQSVMSNRTREKGVLVDLEEYKLIGCDAVEQTDQQLVDQHIDFDFIKQFGDNWGDDFGSLRNLLRQFYSLNAVTELLVREKEKFDLVIFSRVDLRFEKPIEIPHLRARTLYTPWFERYRGLNDRFALGDQETMIAYGRRQSMAREYCAETGGPMTAEEYLLLYAKKHGLHTRHLRSMNFSRARANGRIVVIKDTPTEKLKFYCKRGLELVGLRRH